MATTEDNGSAATAAKTKTEYEKVVMTDGREVNFPGKRQLSKEITIDIEAQTVSVRFDLRNGDTFTVKGSELDPETYLQALGHGISQKVGDAAAGTPKLDDTAIAIEDMVGRLKKGEWAAPREAGDSFAGAGLVVRAVAEATGKSIEFVKEFLSKKLEKAKAAGEKLTRNDLYASFRNPESATGKIIEKMEREERAKATKVDSSALLAELNGGAHQASGHPATHAA